MRTLQLLLLSCRCAHEFKILTHIDEFRGNMINSNLKLEICSVFYSSIYVYVTIIVVLVGIACIHWIFCRAVTVL